MNVADVEASQRSVEVSTRRRSLDAVVDITFALLVAATVAWFAYETRSFGLRGDDWRIAPRGDSVGDYFQPYNDVFIPVPIAIYRVVYEVFGFGTYVPLRVVGIGSGVGVAVAIYLVVRTRVGVGPAFVAGVIMLWYPDLRLAPAAFNHYLALVATIVCAWLLAKPRWGSEIGLGAALALALGCSGVGVSAAAACLVYVAVSRAPLRQWIAVAVPTAAWLAWWLLVPDRSDNGKSLYEIARAVPEGFVDSFAGLAFGRTELGILLMLAYAVLLGWRLRRGVGACANELAWIAALATWWVGLAYSRPSSVTEPVRYELVGTALVILACLPTTRSTLPTTRSRNWRRVDARAVVAASLVIGGLVVVVNRPGISSENSALKSEHRQIRQGLIVANLGPDVLADSARLFVGGGTEIASRHYRELVAEFGTPFATEPANPDSAIVDLARIRPRVADDPADANACTPLAGPTAVAPAAHLVLRTDDEAAAVTVRRFSPDPVDVGRIPPRAVAILDLPGLSASSLWTLDAPGACVDFGVTMQTPRNLEKVQRTVELLALTNTLTPVRQLEFHASGGRYDDRTIGTATLSYAGLAYTWDTREVPNGRYSITAVATHPDGNTAVSRPTTVIVEH